MTKFPGLLARDGVRPTRLQRTDSGVDETGRQPIAVERVPVLHFHQFLSYCTLLQSNVPNPWEIVEFRFIQGGGDYRLGMILTRGPLPRIPQGNHSVVRVWRGAEVRFLPARDIFPSAPGLELQIAFFILSPVCPP
jgi:hypothetical protein